MIRVEFIRQLRRPRTWGLLGAVMGVPIAIAIANWVESGGGGTLRRNLYYLGTNNGVNFGVLVLLVMGNFFVVVITATFAGESVSGEATWGTLRYLLIRPVKRTRLVLAKMFVSVVLAFAVTFLLVTVAVVIGALLFGWKDVFTLGGGRVLVTVPPWEGVGRLAIACLYVSVSMLFVVSVALLLSTLTDSTAAAVVGAIVVVVTCGVLREVPSFEGIKPIIPTNYWGEWNGLFNRDGTSDLWKGVVESVSWATAISIAAVIRFAHKDITS